MRKWILFVIAIICFCAPLTVNAANKPIQVYIDGNKVTFDVDPIQENGTILVQFRPIFEALGLSIDWDQNTKTVTGTKDGLMVKLIIGDIIAYVNDKKKHLTLPPRTIQGNTLLPLRFVGEASGKEVSWDAGNQSVNISTVNNSSNTDSPSNIGNTSENSCSTLSQCITNNSVEKVKRLLEENYSFITSDMVESAIKTSNVDMVKLLLSKYNLKTSNSFSQDGIITTAIRQKDYAIVELLLDEGIDPNIVVSVIQENTPLTLAIRENDINLVKLLVEKGADPSKILRTNQLGGDENEWYYSALNLAYELGNAEIYSYIKQAAMVETPAPNDITLHNTTEIRNYLNSYFSKINTNLGIALISYSINENTLNLRPYDYQINFQNNYILIDESLNLGINYISFEDLLQDTRFSQSQKEMFVQQLREHTESTARKLTELLPSKKITGGYLRFTSFVPSWVPSELYRVASDVYGSSSARYFTWSNYSPDESMYYDAAEITEFHWAGSYDDANLTTAIPLKSIIISNSIYEVDVGKTIQIPFQLFPSDSTDVELTWTALHPDRASVDQNGIVTGLKDGFTTITVRSKHDSRIYAFAFVQVGDLLKM